MVMRRVYNLLVTECIQCPRRCSCTSTSARTRTRSVLVRAQALYEYEYSYSDLPACAVLYPNPARQSQAAAWSLFVVALQPCQQHSYPCLYRWQRKVWKSRPSGSVPRDSFVWTDHPSMPEVAQPVLHGIHLVTTVQGARSGHLTHRRPHVSILPQPPVPVRVLYPFLTLRGRAVRRVELGQGRSCSPTPLLQLIRHCKGTPRRGRGLPTPTGSEATSAAWTLRTDNESQEGGPLKKAVLRQGTIGPTARVLYGGEISRDEVRVPVSRPLIIVL